MVLDRETIVASQQHVVEVFRSFRDTLLEHYGNVNFVLKDDHSQVTELDVLVETTLKEALADKFPMLGFAGEETGKDEVQANQPYWLVDPIDGTSSFIRGLPNCTNMAALIVDDQPIAAVIYDFVTDVLYTARAGEGAFRDGEPLRVSGRTLERSAMYMDGFRMPMEYRQPLRDANVGVYRPMGASGRAYTLVAEGKMEGYSLIDGRASSHDNAPGVLLALEAGAEIVTLGDASWTIHSKNFVVVTPGLAVLWHELMK